MARYSPWCMIALVWCLGCDDNRSRVEAGEDDRRDAAMPDASDPDTAVVDAEAMDAVAAPDAAMLDAALVDGPPLPDAASPDVAVPDMTVDADPDAAAPDMAGPDADLGGRFVTGIAVAADRLTPVTVTAGDVSTVADADGRFRLGPLPVGDAVIEFDADLHQSEALSIAVPADDGDTPLPEDMVLYRGVRVGAPATGRMVFRFDEGWFLWEIDDQLWSTPTDPLDIQLLVPEQHEVFLGFQSGGDAIFTRRRTRPGIAGDIDQRPLDGSPAIPLFVEAQPWVREVGDRLLAMVQTREALSRLVSTTVGGEPDELDAGVPWLLVTTLAERVAWAAGDGPGFGVFVGAADGSDVQQVSLPDGPTSDEFLLTTPDRRGVVWISPAGDLWRWPGEGDAARLAQGVLFSPRPRLLRDGRVVFARAGEPGRIDFSIVSPDGERLIVDGARPAAGLVIGDMFYVVRPGRGLWAGDLGGAGGDDVLGDPIEALSSSGGGVLALIDGEAWRYHPDTGAEALGGDGLSLMSFSPLGATAWQADRGELWFLPGPGIGGEATPLLAGAERPGRVNAPGGAAMYALGPDGWLRIALPPGAADDVAFDRAVETLTPLGTDGLLARDGDGGLWSIDPATGTSTGWAFGVERLDRSARNGWVAYSCDRGTFLVPVPAPAE